MLSSRGENNILLIPNTFVRKILLSPLEDKIHIFAPRFWDLILVTNPLIDPAG